MLLKQNTSLKDATTRSRQQKKLKSTSEKVAIGSTKQCKDSTLTSKKAVIPQNVNGFCCQHALFNSPPQELAACNLAASWINKVIKGRRGQEGQ